MSDPRIDAGLGDQLAQRRGLLADGSTALGWKAGFGAARAREQFGLSGPLVGFMTDASLVEDGSVLDVSPFPNPVAEAEVAVWLGEDLPEGADEAAVRQAVSHLGPAIELADIHPPPDSVRGALSANLFHTGVVLAGPGSSRTGVDLAGLEARVSVDGEERTAVRDLEDLPGRIPVVVSHLARLLADHGERMRAGEVVICGAVVPPLPLTPGMSFRYELAPLGSLSVRTARSAG